MTTPRIGQTVRPRLPTHPRHADQGEIVHIHPDGTAGITDPAGVLVIRLTTGSVIHAAAGEWVTA